MRILLAGDIHGNAKHLQYLYARAVDNDVDCIVQLGDYGYWEHMKGGPEFLEVNADLAHHFKIPFYWIDGNHENFELLNEKYNTHPEVNEFVQIRPGVNYIPRGTTWTWDDVTFMGFGGAYSIDKGQRVKYVSWWPEEQPSEADISRAIERGGEVDVKVMFTHDVPTEAPIGEAFEERGHSIFTDIREANESRFKVSKVVREVKPDWIFHGHYHLGYGPKDFLCDNKLIHIVGLAHDFVQPPQASWTVLDTNDFK